VQPQVHGAAAPPLEWTVPRRAKPSAATADSGGDGDGGGGGGSGASASWRGWAAALHHFPTPNFLFSALEGSQIIY
jgi:hypothetical protein